MEIELKYVIDDREKVEKILNDPSVTEIKDENSDESIDMHAVYFDTEDRILSANEAAFRIRREGKKLMATLKWGGSCENGMHRREEINIPVEGEEQLVNPDMSIFDETEVGPGMKKLLKDRKVVPIMDIDFLRRQMRLDTGRAICELSIDEGEVVCGRKKDRILELEIELYSGDEGEIVRLGNEISDRYGLIAGNISKFQRGLRLLMAE